MGIEVKKIVIIHGATNTSNFGDVLFASIFMQRLEENDNVIPFFLEMPQFGVGDFVRKELNYTRSLTKEQKYNADVLVYMSGGYFGDNSKSMMGTFRRWIRYVSYGTYMRRKKKDILICGVGGGPLYSSFLRKRVVQIMNSARFIAMRDEQSRDYFLKAGVNIPIEATADTALSIKKSDLPILIEANEIETIFRNKKRLVIHLVMDKESDQLFFSKIVPAIKTFLREREDFGIIFITDSVCDYSNLLSYNALKSERITYSYKYRSAWQLCTLLNTADAVITMKLHVGIVSATLGKSVISFPMHQYKTKRFYSQIGESDRCAQLTDIYTQKAYEMIKRYIDIKIDVPDYIRNEAEKNLLILDTI